MAFSLPPPPWLTNNDDYVGRHTNKCTKCGKPFDVDNFIEDESQICSMCQLKNRIREICSNWDTSALRYLVKEINKELRSARRR